MRAAAVPPRCHWRCPGRSRSPAAWRSSSGCERTAATDPLTGVLNRRGLGEAAERELARAHRHDRPFPLTYLDVRGLKAVNDGQGHLVGDEVIRQVVALLHNCARAGDVIGRLLDDGESFQTLLSVADRRLYAPRGIQLRAAT